MTNVSEVLINIGRAINGDSSILSSCKSLFGKGIQVFVGGYAQNIASESDAPFALVLADNTESDVNTKDVLSLSVKVIVGICPVKDAPSTDKVDSDLSYTSINVGTGAEEVQRLDNLLEEGEDKTFVEAKLEEIETAKESLATAVSAVSTAKAASDYPTMIEKYGDAKTAAYPVATKLAEIYYHFQPIPSGLEDVLHAIDNVSMSLVSTIAAFTSDLTALTAEYAAFEENPYITDVVSARSETANGLTIYGAQRILDDIRSKVVDAVYAAELGMIVESVRVNCNSTSHYPLDWSEIVIDLEKPTGLNV